MTNFVTCLICLKNMKKISPPHLKCVHGLTISAYLEKFPDAKLTSDKSRELMRIRMAGRKITWSDKISKSTQKNWKNGKFLGRTGIQLSEKSKALLSQKMMGHDVSKEARLKIGEAGIGRDAWNAGLTKETDERVARIAEKVSVYNLNMPEETRDKIASTLKEKYARGELKPPCSKSGFRTDLGMYFRSTWEANFARVLLYNKKPIIYENRHIPINLGKTLDCVYISDFEVDGKLIEIKGHAESSNEWTCNCVRCERDKRKINGLKLQYPEIIIEIFGKKDYSKMASEYKSNIPKWENSCYDRYKS